MKETVTDYKTVEEQYERTLCDECGKEADPSVTVGVNPRVGTTSRQLIREFDSAEQAHAEEMDRRRRKIEMARYTETLGHGLFEETMTEPADATAQLDWCLGCLEEKTDIELPEGDVTDADFETAPPEITVTKDARINIHGGRATLMGVPTALFAYLFVMELFPLPTLHVFVISTALGIAAGGIIDILITRGEE